MYMRWCGTASGNGPLREWYNRQKKKCALQDESLLGATAARPGAALREIAGMKKMKPITRKRLFIEELERPAAAVAGMTTLAIGEETSHGKLTTLAIGEEAK